MTALLEARNVTKIFGGGFFNKTTTLALENFSFSLDADEPTVTAVVGESGSGKTTLARILLGLETPTEGEVLYQGKNLQSLGDRERRAFLRDVQVIFQDPFEVYNPFYKIDHVLHTPITNFGLAKNRTHRREMIEEALSAVGLRPEETLGRYPHHLSGGQRQRVMVARALLLRPRVIIADEPVSMVDASLRATILASLLKLTAEFGISLIYITHDLTTAYQVSDNMIVLYRGGVAEVGDVETIVQDPHHPYTQLLVGSVPLPDPDETWEAERGPAKPFVENGTDPTKICKFANRCPFTMPICVEEAPPLFKTAEYRAASCYLHRESPVLPHAEMKTVFAPAKDVSGRVKSSLDEVLEQA